jgi:Uma2 family endonuclease
MTSWSGSTVSFASIPTWVELLRKRTSASRPIPSVGPDVAFICAAKLESVDPRKRLDFAPDLATEIASPNDDLPSKIQDYLAAGARVWALYPDARIARIHQPGEQTSVRDADAKESLEEAELLAGLKIPLAEIFG